MLTTHNMDEADALCDRIAIIDHGSMIAQGTPAELKASIPGGYLLRLRFSACSGGTGGRLEADCRASPKSRTERTRRRCLCRSRRPADRRHRRRGAAQARRRTARCAHLRAESGKSVPAPHRKEPARNELENIFRPARARWPRGAPQLPRHCCCRTMLQPLLFVFVFGQVMTASGMMHAEHTKACCCPASWRSAW